MSQIGGELLQKKLNSPVHQVKYEPWMYNEFPPGALVIVDWRTEDQLSDATIRAVQSGAFKRIRVLMFLNVSTLVSKERLLTVNMCLCTMWSCMAVIVKPCTARINVDRKEDNSVPTSTIPGIAEELNAATSKIEKLLKLPNKLLAIHWTRGVVTQGPLQPHTWRSRCQRRLTLICALCSSRTQWLAKQLYVDRDPPSQTTSIDSSRRQGPAKAVEATTGVAEVTRGEDAEANGAEWTKGTGTYRRVQRRALSSTLR